MVISVREQVSGWAGKEMAKTSNGSGPKGPDQCILGDVALHIDEGPVSVHGAAPKFGPAHQQVCTRRAGLTADDTQTGLDDPLRAIFLPAELAIIAHARKHGR